MKIEEAIKQFEEWEDSGWSKSEAPNSMALCLAMQYLEKQIPKEVVSHNGLNETRCPKCNGVFGYSLELDEYTGEKFDYCYECGQALKWGGDNED